MATVIIYLVLGLVVVLSPFAYCGWLQDRHGALAEQVKILRRPVGLFAPEGEQQGSFQDERFPVR